MSETPAWLPLSQVVVQDNVVVDLWVVTVRVEKDRLVTAGERWPVCKWVQKPPLSSEGDDEDRKVAVPAGWYGHPPGGYSIDLVRVDGSVVGGTRYSTHALLVHPPPRDEWERG